MDILKKAHTSLMSKKDLEDCLSSQDTTVKLLSSGTGLVIHNGMNNIINQKKIECFTFNVKGLNVTIQHLKDGIYLTPITVGMSSGMNSNLRLIGDLFFRDITDFTMIFTSILNKMKLTRFHPRRSLSTSK